MQFPSLLREHAKTLQRFYYKFSPTNYTTGTRTAHKPHVVFSGRTQLCVAGVSTGSQALKVGKNSPRCAAINDTAPRLFMSKH
ncbi:hypothetical protein J6590_046489 [Homalodisca vitripennis]|nr:hypothetical protein J6590_046489 [Homalodisca vitripennis]